jgi:hypothetical protein
VGKKKDDQQQPQQPQKPEKKPRAIRTQESAKNFPKNTPPSHLPNG